MGIAFRKNFCDLGQLLESLSGNFGQSYWERPVAANLVVACDGDEKAIRAIESFKFYFPTLLKKCGPIHVYHLKIGEPPGYTSQLPDTLLRCDRTPYGSVVPFACEIELNEWKKVRSLSPLATRWRKYIGSRLIPMRSTAREKFILDISAKTPKLGEYIKKWERSWWDDE